MNKTTVLIIVTLMVSVGFLCGCNEESSNNDDNLKQLYDSPVTINASKNSGLLPLEVKFTSQVNNFDYATKYYIWDFGDENQSIEENPTHIYESVGIYEVRLDVFNKSPHAKDADSSDIKFVTGKTIIRVEKNIVDSYRPILKKGPYENYTNNEVRNAINYCNRYIENPDLLKNEQPLIYEEWSSYKARVCPDGKRNDMSCYNYWILSFAFCI